MADELNWFDVQKIYREASLNANRQGNFHDAQKKVIKARLGDSSCGSALLMAAGMIISSFFFFLVIPSLLPLKDLSIPDWIYIPYGLLVIFGPLVGILLWVKRRARRRIEKILSSKIESDYGRYIFDFGKKRYAAFRGQTIMEELFPVNYEPGAYKFYMIQKPALLLSAEPCEAALVPAYDPETQSLPAILQRLFEFNDDDLTANRNGQLSERQKSMWGGIFRKKEEKVAFVAGQGRSKPYGQISGATAAADIAMNFLGPLPNAIFQFGKTVKPSEKHMYYIGDKTFEVSESAWVGLVDGLLYKAYFLTGTNKLLSIELVTT